MRRLIKLIAVVLTFGLASNAALAAPLRTVRTTGDERVIPNAMVQATLRFTPGPISVSNGDENHLDT